jgi:hypothetical protein
MVDTIDLDKVADFYIKYGHFYADKEFVKTVIKRHIEYNTIFVVNDNNGEVGALCRWNVIDNGDTADVLDLYIREDWRDKRIIEGFLKRSLEIFPTLKYIKFRRNKKYSGRERILSIERILNGR